MAPERSADDVCARCAKARSRHPRADCVGFTTPEEMGRELANASIDRAMRRAGL